uniref:AlNc14C317G10547 protein n=1 Tax=Albugo laibachii Nc14 TaxID=890382 RepID=F0WWB2_9STRA|nr:AlNc14C317G10547 [Albugo laibachii Nc14]|eukprot:CCA25732.1 AlNc14C317G10547 [Albugo laibachii Nc14]
MDDAKYQKRDLTSEQLAQKMLQGWTMMGCHCPQCFTPFMRNKDEMLYCVQCEQYAVFEDEKSTKDYKAGKGCDTKMHEAQSTSSEAIDGVAVKRAMDDLVEKDVALLPCKKRLIASIYQVLTRHID